MSKKKGKRKTSLTSNLRTKQLKKSITKNFGKECIKRELVSYKLKKAHLKRLQFSSHHQHHETAHADDNYFGDNGVILWGAV